MARVNPRGLIGKFRPRLLIRGKYHATAGYHRPRNCQKYFSESTHFTAKGRQPAVGSAQVKHITRIGRLVRLTGKVEGDIYTEQTRDCSR